MGFSLFARSDKGTPQGGPLSPLLANIEDLTEEQAREYLKFANAVAGLCVEKRGAIPAMPTLEQVMNEL